MNELQQPRRKKRDPIDIEKQYLSGMSTNEIASSYGVNGITIRRDLIKTMTKMRSVGIPRKYQFNTQAFRNIDNEEAAYWLGFLYADGSVNWIARTVVLIIIDKDHLEKFQTFLRSNYNIKFNDKRKIYRLTISSIELIHDLMNHGCVPGKTKRLSFPTIPPELQRHFIRGFFDGDGSWSINLKKKNFAFSIGSTSLQILLQIQEFLIANCDLSRHKIYSRWDFHDLKYGGPQIIRIGRYLYNGANIRLDRKYSAFEKFEKWLDTRDCVT